MRSMVASSRDRPKASPQAVRTAGATWTTVILSGSARAENTSMVSSRSRRPPVGQWVMHWPHRAQSESFMTRFPDTSIMVRPPVPDTSQMLSVCTLSHTWMQRIHLMHLL